MRIQKDVGAAPVLALQVEPYMGRHKVILQSDFPYNISARCINREWFSLPMDQVWDLMSEELYLTHRYFNLHIHAFVLMSNHFHLLASTPDANISKAMHYFMSRTSKRLTEAGNRINQTYSGRHFKCILQAHQYFLNAYKYNYRNPVDAGICNSVLDYPYSTLQGLLGAQRLLIPLVEDTTLFSDPEGTIRWLEEKPEAERLEAMRWALKHDYFTSPKIKSNGRPILNFDDAL